MDNVTHALAGMLLADATVEALAPRGSRPDPAFRNRARWASAVANNLPDLDFLYRGVTPGRLGYLLHHRGHTHTFLVGMGMGLVSFALLRRLWRSRSLGRRELRTLLALSLVGPLVHMTMDFSNSYGVHTLWPLYDGWVYGDFIFIIEPLYFIASVPALALASRTRAGKLLLGAIVLIALGLAWVTRFAGVGTASMLTVSAVAVAALTYLLRPRARTWFAVALCACVAGTFFGASRVARARVVEAAAARSHTGPVRVIDASLTPAPANPFCWSVMAAGLRGDSYELLVATVSVAPKLVPTKECELEPTGESLALSLPGLAPTASVRWDGEWSRPVAELRGLFREDCEVRAYLRWARLPFWFREGKHGLFLGDLRYDRRPGLDFAELRGTIPPASCPRFVPPWIPPRHELLPEE
jgi:inner membrane protein